MAEFTIKEYKFLDKQPAGTFDKPQRQTITERVA